VANWHDYKGKYDVADFVVPPEIGKGKSQRIQCYVQAAHYRLLNIVARSGHFPFEERNDVIRWCIDFGLKYLDTLEPGLTRSVMSQANIMNRRLQDLQYQEKFLEWMENAKSGIAAAVSRGDDSSAREEVAFMYREIMKMPTEPDRALRWKLKYLDTLREHFRQYMPDEASE
jgi:hypothetical protein